MKIYLNIPSSLRDLSLANYQAYEASKKTDYDLLKNFLKIKDKHIEKLPAKAVSSLVSDLNKLFNESNTFYNHVKIGGVMYGFIPNMSSMTYGEYIDLTTYVGDWADMHKAMAVLFRPIVFQKGKDYVIEDYESSEVYSDKLKAMPLDVVLGAVFFLINLQTVLLSDTLKSTISNLTEQELTAFQKSGGNIIHLSTSLIALKQQWKPLQLLT